jgi:hypothetical protein
MISKGTTHNNGAKLAAYMTTGKEGERAELWQLRGFGAANIKDAFRDVQIMAGATRCEQPFFHVQVRNRDGEKLTREQWEYAAGRIEKMLGLTGQPRAIAFHKSERDGHEHMHVAWSRIDQDTLTAKPLPFFKTRLKNISRELEIHFGLEPVTNERKGHIKYAPTRAEDEQARRLGLDIHEVRDTIRSCYERSDCGKSFQAALEHEGFILARGERRDYIVVDGAGGLHALGKRILGDSAAEIRARLSDLPRAELPTVEQARALIQNAERTRQPQTRNATRQRHGNREKEWAGGAARGRAPRPREIRIGNPTIRDRAPSIAAGARTTISGAGATSRALGKALDFAGDAFASLFAPELTPAQKREAERTAAKREAEQAIDLSRYTAEQARHLERERESALSKERERDR